eukprot:TRINITY_DN44113_c0_g1_i1.p2 TRINITY_DN44113_c0_g1~~TRINITY_DN44113_c0_g1_i1.p2  ORF type:complete len:191 (+),score=76.27 TRINITY_DN44113_c0_g1_i1:65-574(+)
MVDVSADDEASWKEQFTKLAEATTGSSEQIELKDLGRALRMCAQYPTEEEIQRQMAPFMQDDADPEEGRKLHWNDFLSLCHECATQNMRTKEELKEAFRTFDKEPCGQISVNELRFFMTHVGDKLEPEEFAELLAEADALGCLSQPNKDFLQIDDFVNKLYPQTEGPAV